jgi:hypothetical protein
MIIAEVAAITVRDGVLPPGAVAKTPTRRDGMRDSPC